MLNDVDDRARENQGKQERDVRPNEVEDI